MPIVYAAIKSFKTRTTKASAADPLQNQILLRHFGVDLLMALSKLQSKPSTLKRSAKEAGMGVAAPALKRPVGDHANSSGSQGEASTGANSVPLGGSKQKEKQIKIAALKAEMRNFVKGKDQAEIQKWLDTQFNDRDSRPVITEVMRIVCRNCVLAGKGVVEHSLRQCMEARNDCVLPCTRCAAAGGDRADKKHWVANCPH